MRKTTKHFWIEQLRDLERYCNEKGYRVVVKSTEIETIDLANKLITLDSKKNDETTFYLLLHEMGHARLMNNNEKYKKTCGYVFENFCKSSLTHAIAILEEELDAWKEGLVLAKTINFYVDRRKWEAIKTKCISSYVAWVDSKKQVSKKQENKKDNK